jgi:hypothetical protein
MRGFITASGMTAVMTKAITNLPPPKELVGGAVPSWPGRRSADPNSTALLSVPSSPTASHRARDPAPARAQPVLQDEDPHARGRPRAVAKLL